MTDAASDLSLKNHWSQGPGPLVHWSQVHWSQALGPCPLVPRPWALVHWSQGPGPLSTGPRALGAGLLRLISAPYGAQGAHVELAGANFAPYGDQGAHVAPVGGQIRPKRVLCAPHGALKGAVV